jgi:hypothetical protein
MPYNPELTSYDDNGHPSEATHTITSTFAGGNLKQTPGRLVKVVVTTAFTGAGGTLSFYDNATGASTGTPLLTIPVAAGTVGAIFNVDMPVSAGISAVNASLTAGAVTLGVS